MRKTVLAVAAAVALGAATMTGSAMAAPRGGGGGMGHPGGMGEAEWATPAEWREWATPVASAILAVAWRWLTEPQVGLLMAMLAALDTPDTAPLRLVTPVGLIIAVGLVIPVMGISLSAATMDTFMGPALACTRIAVRTTTGGTATTTVGSTAGYGPRMATAGAWSMFATSA